MLRRSERAGVLALAAILMLAVSASVSTTSAATQTTVAPSDDTYASGTNQTTVNGASTLVKVRADATSIGPPNHGYLKFTVSGVSGLVTSATLKVYSIWNSAYGLQVRAVNNTTWSESTLTWANAPTYSSTVTSSSSSYSANVWISLDVSSLVTGNGTYSFALTTPNGETAIASKENGAATAPQLVIQSAAAPANTTLPSISGTATDGQTMNASPGTWSGDQPLSYTYQWRRCDSSGSNCTDLSGATGQNYSLSPADVGSTLRVVVTASNSAGSSSSTAAASSVVQALAPTNTSLPTVSGTTRTGQTLTATSGSWTGTPPLGYFYQWRRCDSTGGTCTDISGATAQTYSIGAADVGMTIRAAVTASNSGGSSSAVSAATTSVSGVGPTNTSAPSISGTTQNGQTLTADNGGWSSDQPISYAYQWQRCDSSGATCGDVAGATGQVYTLGPGDIGSTIRVAVIASTSSGSTTAYTAPTSLVLAVPPTNTTPPTISGTPQDGQTLSASNGSWNGDAPFTYSYQWRRCDGTGANCADIGGATGQNYNIGSGDVGSTIAVAVTASNGGSSSTAGSATTAGIAPMPSPCGTSAAAPSVTKVLWIFLENHDSSQVIGQSSAPYLNQLAGQCGLATNYSGVTHPSLPNYIAATSGSTQGINTDSDPSVYPLSVPSIFGQVQSKSYEESMPSNCTLVSADPYWAKHNPQTYYTPVSADCQVNNVPMGDTNSGAFVNDLGGGTLPKFSFVTPNICNDMHDCGVATGDSWLHTWLPRIFNAPDYQAGRLAVFVTFDENDQSPGNHVPTIVASPYTPQGTQSAIAYNHYSLLRTAEDLFGVQPLGNAATATSMALPFGLMLPTPPTNWSAPSLSGTAQDGQTLAASAGAWGGLPLPSYAYQWRRCDGTGANCTDIGGATGQNYSLSPIDVGSTLRVAVTASNSAGSSSASSAASSAVQAIPPSNTALPTVSGPTTTGQTLNATGGSWSGTPPLGFFYQWRRCDSGGATCTDISGATGQSYTLGAADVGMTIRFAVIASNGGGSITATSNQTLVVQTPGQPPANVAPPTISGTTVAGWTLTAASGTWSGDQPISYAYQWQRCDGGGANCTNIPGATASSYRLGPADVGATLAVNATASNTAGSSSQSSSPTAVIQSTVTIAPTDDTFASGTNQTTVNGTNTLVKVRGDSTSIGPPNHGYLKFTLSGLTGGVTSATLRLYGSWSSAYGLQVRSVSDTTWSENTLTWANAPTYSTTVTSSSSSYNANTWISLDVTPLVTGNGTYSFALTTPNGETALASKEAGAGTAPQLIVQPAAATLPKPPSNTTPPTISGNTVVGSTLTATTGSWTGDSPIAYAFQWRRCDTGGNNCADIAGGNSASYTLGSTDVGSTIRVNVTATNSVGSSTQSSAATSMVGLSDPVIGAAGDIACDPADSNFNGGNGTASACHEKAVSDLLLQSNPTAVLGLGDEQYECAGLGAFGSSYDPTWGRLKSITYPATGNHEYQTSGGTGCDASGGAGGYFSYFGSAAGDPSKGYYSFDIGAWHLISLNANCAKVGGCGVGSPQEVWLQNDLATHSNLCTLAYWHNPRFSSGSVGNDGTYGPFWQDLYNANADVVLAGHDHDYERFAPQNPSAGLDAARGIREFVVGTGGKSHFTFSTVRVNSQVRNADAFGYLKLTLHPSSYDWQFVGDSSSTFTDSGSSPCH